MTSHPGDHGDHAAQAGHPDHTGHPDNTEHPDHAGHGDHAGHAGHVERFRRLFWINLLLAVPVVAFSPMFAMILGYSVPDGATWIAPLLGSVMFFWGGWPFLTGAVGELRSRRPGMMLLIGLAISGNVSVRNLIVGGLVPLVAGTVGGWLGERRQQGKAA